MNLIHTAPLLVVPQTTVQYSRVYCTVLSTVHRPKQLNYSDGKGQCGGTIAAVIYLNKAEPLEKVNMQV